MDSTPIVKTDIDSVFDGVGIVDLDGEDQSMGDDGVDPVVERADILGMGSGSRDDEDEEECYGPGISWKLIHY